MNRFSKHLNFMLIRHSRRLWLLPFCLYPSTQLQTWTEICAANCRAKTLRCRSSTTVSSATDTANPFQNEVLEHARAICGSCKSSPEAVTSLITLCHTIFVWGPLLTNESERKEVLEILSHLESSQRWPTAWIAKALKEEWRIG